MVRPMNILQDQQETARRCGGPHCVDQLLQDAILHRRLRQDAGKISLGKRSDERFESRDGVTPIELQGFHDGPERPVPFELGRVAAQYEPSLCFARAGDLFNEPRLADPGLTLNDDERFAAAPLVKELRDARDLCGAASEGSTSDIHEDIVVLDRSPPRATRSLC